MNEKTHYDNLERLAKRRSVDDLTEYMAELYNALDLLCIHFDCADMVQDMAEDLCSVQARR